jgi:hypothetical protein
MTNQDEGEFGPMMTAVNLQHPYPLVQLQTTASDTSSLPSVTVRSHSSQKGAADTVVDICVQGEGLVVEMRSVDGQDDTSFSDSSRTGAEDKGSISPSLLRRVRSAPVMRLPRFRSFSSPWRSPSFSKTYSPLDEQPYDDECTVADTVKVTLQSTDTMPEEGNTTKVPEACRIAASPSPERPAAPVDCEVRDFINQIAQELQAPSSQEGEELFNHATTPGLASVSSGSSDSSGTPTNDAPNQAADTSALHNFDAVEVTSTEVHVQAVDSELERFKHQMQASLLLSSRDEGEEEESQAARPRMASSHTSASFTDDAFEEETFSELINREKQDADEDWVTILSQAWQTSVLGEDHESGGIEIESVASSQRTGFWNDTSTREPATPLAYSSYRIPLNDTWAGSIMSQSSDEEASFFGIFFPGSRSTEDDYSLTAASYVSETSTVPRKRERFRKGYVITLATTKDSQCEGDYEDDEGDQAFVPLSPQEAAAAQAVWDSLPAAFGTPLRVPTNDEGGEAFAPLPPKEAAAAQAVWDSLPSAFGVSPRALSDSGSSFGVTPGAASDAGSSISWTASDVSESPSIGSISSASSSDYSPQQRKSRPRRVMPNRSMMSYGSTTLGSIVEDREGVMAKLKPWRPLSCLYGD